MFKLKTITTLPVALINLAILLRDSLETLAAAISGQLVSTAMTVFQSVGLL